MYKEVSIMRIITVRADAVSVT